MESSCHDARDGKDHPSMKQVWEENGLLGNSGDNWLATEYQEMGSDCWLRFDGLRHEATSSACRVWAGKIVWAEALPCIQTAVVELVAGLGRMTGVKPERGSLPSSGPVPAGCVMVGTIGGSSLVNSQVTGEEASALGLEGFLIKRIHAEEGESLLLAGKTGKGILYGAFHLLRMLQCGEAPTGAPVLENPACTLRLLNQWDNMDGSIERGYAGRSIIYEDNRFKADKRRMARYARLLASVGINGLVINNVNVKENETRLLTDALLPEVAEVAGIFRVYGVRIYLSINFASPIRIGGLETADPEEPAVRAWWKEKATEVYRAVPDFGGFLVKADSEFNPGPYAYNRTHAQGANMLAEALSPHGGLVIWRCFVYNCLQDWRDMKTDRARAAYDNFMPLDGAFADNVVLQIKNGPMDFQVREPVSPLLGAMRHTNQIMELQVTQEYTGQQKHLCYLVPQWKEILAFDTHMRGQGSPVRRVVDGSLYNRSYNGLAAVSNIGGDPFWTGHPLAQANLYGYGRLAWNPDLTAEEIAREWIRLTYDRQEEVLPTVLRLLMDSWPVYESYTVPLGIGWMVNPNHHYGPNVDGYEYDKWGTYHRADWQGIGVDRTRENGTGYTGQYAEPVASRFDSLADCPEELLLFFHHVPYTYRLKSGKTLIQHIYDTHFEGVEQVARMMDAWRALEGLVDDATWREGMSRFTQQLAHAGEWRDVINTYFHRKTGIPDEKGRRIH